MGMISTRILADGRKILSEMTRGVTTTQVFSPEGELLLTRLKSATVKKVPQKVKHVGFIPQEQQKTFITIKKLVSDGETKSCSILDRVYENGVRLGERRLKSDTPNFIGNEANYIKDIFVNEGGQMVHKSQTTVENGIRSMRSKIPNEILSKEKDIIAKLNKIEEEDGKLRRMFYGYQKGKIEAKEINKLKKTYIAYKNNNLKRGDAIRKQIHWETINKYAGKPNSAVLVDDVYVKELPSFKTYSYSFQERKQMRSRMGVLAKQRKELQKEMDEIQQMKRQFYKDNTIAYNNAGLPEGFGHLDRGCLDLNF